MLEGAGEDCSGKEEVEEEAEMNERSGLDSEEGSGKESEEFGFTSRARVQENERLDLPWLQGPYCMKPMAELKSGSNVWYQAYVVKESANEVKVRFPGIDGAHKERHEWLAKGSSRLWRGRMSNSSWRHIGKGAWEPRCAPARKRNRGGGQERSVAAKHVRVQQGRKRSTRAGSVNDDDEEEEGTEVGEEGQEREEDEEDQEEEEEKEEEEEEEEEEVEGDARQGPGSKDAAARTQGEATVPQAPLESLASLEQQQEGHRFKQPQSRRRRARVLSSPVGSASTYSQRHVGDLEEGTLVEQQSTRSSPVSQRLKSRGQKLQRQKTWGSQSIPLQLAPAAEPQAPALSPLAAWFHAHYSLLAKAETLCLLSGNSIQAHHETGLPTGFSFNPHDGQVIAKHNQHSPCDSHQTHPSSSASSAAVAAAARKLPCGGTCRLRRANATDEGSKDRGLKGRACCVEEEGKERGSRGRTEEPLTARKGEGRERGKDGARKLESVASMRQPDQQQQQRHTVHKRGSGSGAETEGLSPTLSSLTQNRSRNSRAHLHMVAPPTSPRSDPVLPAVITGSAPPSAQAPVEALHPPVASNSAAAAAAAAAATTSGGQQQHAGSPPVSPASPFAAPTQRDRLGHDLQQKHEHPVHQPTQQTDQRQPSEQQHVHYSDVRQHSNQHSQQQEALGNTQQLQQQQQQGTGMKHLHGQAQHEGPQFQQHSHQHINKQHQHLQLPAHQRTHGWHQLGSQQHDQLPHQHAQQPQEVKINSVG